MRQDADVRAQVRGEERAMRAGIAVVVVVTLLLVAMGAWIVIDNRRSDWFEDCLVAQHDLGEGVYQYCSNRAPTFG